PLLQRPGAARRGTPAREPAGNPFGVPPVVGCRVDPGDAVPGARRPADTPVQPGRAESLPHHGPAHSESVAEAPRAGRTGRPPPRRRLASPAVVAPLVHAHMQTPLIKPLIPIATP